MALLPFANASSGGGGSGTVTSVSVVGANGLAGTVANATTTPAITLSTSVTGILQGNGTAISAATTTGSGSVVLGTTPTIATPVLNGTPTGTGVATAATASTLTLRDSNANIFTNNYLGGATATTSAGGTTVLTAASTRFQALTGSSAQTYQLPDATTLSLGPWFVFNNNSSQSLTITNNGGSTLYTVPAGGIIECGPSNIGTANGSWDFHGFFPSTVTWGSGVTGLVFNTALTTTPSINAGISSSTTPSFIPQRGSSTTGFGGDSTHLYGSIGGAAKFTSTATTFSIASGSQYQINGTQIAASDLSNGTTGSGAVVLATSATLVTPALGTPTALVGTNITGTAAGLTAGNVTTNANLTGVITSVGNATSIASQTGTGTKFVVDTSPTIAGHPTIEGVTSTGATGTGKFVFDGTPTLVTPVLGVATATSVNKVAITAPASSATLTIADGKTLTVSNSITLAGTDSTVMTFPNTSQTVVGLTATQSITNKTFDNTSPTAFFYPGFIQSYVARVAPTGWLNTDGSAISRSTYAALFAAIVPTLSTITVTIATPAVVTNTAHGLSTGDSIFFTTTGALPTGLTANTLYYIVRVDANSYNVSTTRANAYAGTKINTTGSQSGVHTAWDCPYGLGDGSTTFTLPDFRGRIIAGMDTTGGTSASRLTLAQSQGTYGNLGASGGEQGHQLVTAELASHAHNTAPTTSDGNIVGGGAGGSAASLVQTGAAFRIYSNVNGGSTGSDTSHNNVQPIQLVNYIIKT